MSFRIGRAYARHVYDERRGGGSAASPFARNFAAGPTLTTSIAAGGGTQIPWEVIDSGAPAGVDVPITPQSTGVVRISGVISLKNSTGSAVAAQVEVQVNDVSLTFPNAENATVDADGFEAIPFLAEATGLTIGVTVNVQILVIAGGSDAISAVAESSTLDVQEVAVATG